MNADLAARRRELMRRKLAQAGLREPARRIPRRGDDEAIPLSFAQSRMWLLQQLEPGSAAYNVCLRIGLRGTLDRAALQRSFQRLVQRHEILRTRYVPGADGVPWQVVDPYAVVTMDQTDLRGLDEAKREQVIEEQARRDSGGSYDLATDHPMRLRLLHRGDDDFVLVLVVHHIAWDGFTFNALSRDLSALYREDTTGQPSGLEPLAVQYADFAVWQRKTLTDERLAGDLSYWRDALDPIPENLPLPVDRARRLSPSSAGDRRFHTFAPELTARLVEYAREAGATPFMVVFAAYAALLHRYTGATDVPIGSASMNRDTAELERLIGNFGNTLVLRADLTGDPVFGELVSRVRQVCTDGYAHQSMPFDVLVEKLNPPRQPGRSVLFDVMLLFLTQGLRGLDFPGVEATWETVHNDTTQFDLALEAFLTDGDLRIEATYRDELFEKSTVDRFLAHLESLLAAALATPEVPVGRLEFLGADAAIDWPSASVPDETLVSLFAAQAARTPDADALVFEGDRLTYRELAQRADDLAGVLAARGAGPESVVGVAVTRSAELVVSLLAVLKSGAAYLPLDPSYPADRLAFMIDDAAPVVVLTDARSPIPGLAVDEPLPGERGETRSPAGPNPAYVIYTSGSTGKPKGVTVEHAAIVNRLLWMQDEYRLGPDDRVLQKTPSSFDVSVWEFFWPLITGATLVVAKPDGHKDPAYLVSVIEAESVTTVHFVPSMLRSFVDEPAAVRCTSLRRVICSGEALPSELARRFAGLFTAGLHNLYGPTEAAVDVTYWPAEDGTDSAAGSVPIGRPVWNTQVHVLDRALQPVAPGVTGELYLGGVQLGRGYLNRPGLTASRFVANPFGEGRLYRTGDLVRRNAAGALEFLGRGDDQVKLRGFRIELGEVEAAITALDGVRAAAVVAREDRQQLIAYVIADDPDPAAYRAELAASMPEHLVPSVIMPVDIFPLSPSGKLDRRALPEPEAAVAEGAKPATAEEAVLCGLFAELLGVPGVGAHDDFFALGGHSIMATRLVGRIRAELGAEVALRTVFDAPTPSKLAAALSEVAGARPALTPRPRPRRQPLSAAQRRLWFLYRLEGPSPTYNIPLAVRLAGPLDVDALRAAIADVVSRHEVLRTVYPEFEGKPYQRVLKSAAPLSVVHSAEPELDGRLRDAAKHAFVLDSEPPLSAKLFVLDESTHVLSLLTHHIASDGWSGGRLLADLSAAYTARCRGLRPDWSPLPVQYADYALWQEEVLAKDADAQLAYWTERLAGLPEELPLPADRPRPAVPSFRGDAVPFALAPETHRALRKLARGVGATVFMALQAAVSALLSHLGAGEDIPVGSPIAGRTDPALDGLAGFFVNTLVLRTDLGGDPSFRQLLGRVRDTDLDAHAHQDLPFERLVEALNPARSMARHPLVQVMVAHELARREARPFGAASLVEERVDFFAARLDLSFHLFEYEDADGVDGWLVYSTDLFDRSTVDAIATRLVRLVDALLAAPDQPLSRTSVLSADERRELLADRNATARTVEPGTLPGLITAQVARTPDAVAVIFEGEQLTYAELDERSNRLAGLLRSRGAGPERTVAVSLARSADLIVTLLAIVKTGAAYLPLDPSYPAERLAFMVEDAAPVLLVTWPDGPAGLDVDAIVVADADGLPADAVESGVTGSNPAYVIYTSGSTGKPKGVVVEHAAIVNRLLWMQDEYGLGADDRVLQKTPSSFDVSVWEFFWPLITGATLVVAKPDGHKDPAYLASLIEAERVTTVHFVPSMLRSFVDNGGHGSALRRVLCSGEALPTELARRAADVIGAPVHNLYGPTEAAVDVTYWPVTAGAGESTVPIGRPVWNTTVYVLDRFLRPVPPGVAGELYLGGVQLARGYLNRAGLTASRFVANPFGEGRLYRTGDVVRWTGQDALEYLGRADDQVKIRGFRVELGEIEAAAERLAGVTGAVVTAKDQRLVAYVRGTGLDPLGLRRRLADSLPDHMVPAAVVPLDEFPLTPSGKLDRRALPEPDFAGLAGETRPRTERESVLCGLFAETLRLDKVGADDSFFELGGDSILSVQLVSLARKAGLALSPREIFEHRTPSALAVVAGGLSGTTTDPLEAALGLAEATPIQRWARRENGFGGLAQAVLLVAPPELTAARLTAAVQALLDRHDLLRARWDDALGGLVVPAPGSIDAAHLLNRGDSAALDKEIEAAADRLDPVAGRMLDVVWLGVDRVLLVAHHLVVDGVSWRIIAADLAEAWGQAAAGLAPALDRTGTSFRRWSRLVAEQAEARLPEADLWRDVLRDAPVLFAPDGGSTVRDTELVLSATETAPLLDGAYQAGVHELLLGAVAATVTTWRHRRGLPTGETVLSYEGHGREEQIAEDVDLSGTVGWFTTLAPVRVRLSAAEAAAVQSGGAPAGEIVKRAKDSLRSQPDHGFGYGVLRHFTEELDAPEPGVVVNYLGRIGTGEPKPFSFAPEAPMLRVRPHEGRAADFGLEITALLADGPDGERLRVVLTWLDGVLDRPGADELADLLGAALRGIGQAEGAGPTLSDLSLVSVTQEDLNEFEESDW
ncbi:amino acid adenylation domain-containing protein [Amycolatopsis sp. cg5]|uniref:amino acid adenylation domain-containing protein n=1 Tax=Amycolatopsis sp. cg5 TaxID=3238802 RepID=UPI00352699F2